MSERSGARLARPAKLRAVHKHGLAVFGGAPYPAEGDNPTHFPATIYTKPTFDVDTVSASLDYGDDSFPADVYNLISGEYVASGSIVLAFRLGSQWYCEYCEV